MNTLIVEANELTDITREGYQHDYEKAFEKMSDDQRDWLNRALNIMFPDGHRWINIY